MTFYYSDNDCTYVEENGKIYLWTKDGKGKQSNFSTPDPMTWHECTEKVANEHLRILDAQLSAL